VNSRSWINSGNLQGFENPGGLIGSSLALVCNECLIVPAFAIPFLRKIHTYS
jgi:hypothetical protein